MPFSCTSPFDVRRGVLPFSCKSPFDMRRGGIALLLQISRHATVNRMASGSVGLQSHQGCDRTGESPGGHLVSKASILRENGPDTQETWCQDGDDIYIYIYIYIHINIYNPQGGPAQGNGPDTPGRTTKVTGAGEWARPRALVWV